MFALNLDADNRILSVCDVIEGQPYNIIVEDFPKGDGVDVRDYLYIDGEYVYDPEPKPEPPEPDPDPTGSAAYVTYDELAAAIQEGVNSYGK